MPNRTAAVPSRGEIEILHPSTAPLLTVDAGDHAHDAEHEAEYEYGEE